MSIADGFHWFVYGHGDLGKLGEFYLPNFDSPIMCSIIALISQGVYCWRIYRLSKWKALVLVVGLVSLISWVFAFTSVAVVIWEADRVRYKHRLLLVRPLEGLVLVLL